MDRIAICLLLGAAIVMCGTAASAGEPPAKRLTIAMVPTGPSDGHGAPRALAEARRALTESLGALGARMASPITARAGTPAKVRQAAAPAGRAAASSFVDVAIDLSARPERRTGTYTAHLAMRLRAALYAVNSDGPPQILRARSERRLPWPCPKSCVDRIGARMAKEQARALAPKIFRLARRVASKAARRLAFRGFSHQELGEIRQYLRAFPGFRYIGLSARRAEDWVIGYGSRLDDRALARALNKMLGHMGIPAVVARRDHGFAVARHGGPAQSGPASRQW